MGKGFKTDMESQLLNPVFNYNFLTSDNRIFIGLFQCSIVSPSAECVSCISEH